MCNNTIYCLHYYRHSVRSDKTLLHSVLSVLYMFMSKSFLGRQSCTVIQVMSSMQHEGLEVSIFNVHELLYTQFKLLIASLNKAYIVYMIKFRWAGIAWMVQILAMGWAVWRSNPAVESRSFAPIQTGPGALPASCTVGTGSLSWG